MTLLLSSSSSSQATRAYRGLPEPTGADLEWLSAFPHEKEYLYPPITLLRPLTGNKDESVLGDTTVAVIDAEPHIAERAWKRDEFVVGDGFDGFKLFQVCGFKFADFGVMEFM